MIGHLIYAGIGFVAWVHFARQLCGLSKRNLLKRRPKHPRLSTQKLRARKRLSRRMRRKFSSTENEL